MFTVLLKERFCEKYGRNVFDRYFKVYKNAKELMEKEVNELVEHGAKIVRSLDYFDHTKGFYVYQKDLSIEKDGNIIKITYALLDGFFQDE